MATSRWTFVTSTPRPASEAANFEPTGIQRTSERLGLRSEASGRWEKGVDPHLADRAHVVRESLVQLLARLGPDLALRLCEDSLRLHDSTSALR